jgi:hypothetical protein
MYTVVIDESGEAGIKNIRSEGNRGASPFLTLGASIYRNANERLLFDELEKLASMFRKNNLHCSELSHVQKLKFARDTSELPLQFFGVISKKETLESYKSRIGVSPSLFYNKCCQYVLEILGEIIQRYRINPSDVKIVFEEGNFDYEALKNFIRACQKNPIHPGAERLQYIAVENITSIPKPSLHTLALADLSAHALYKCVDQSEKNYGLVDVTYLREIGRRFHSQERTYKVLGHGIKCIRGIATMKLGPVDKVDSQISGSVIQDYLLGGGSGSRRPHGY